MEKQNWSLIFLALCLVLAFSVSPVEAQLPCDPCGKCDRDGDTLIKDSRRCRSLCEAPFGFDPMFPLVK